MVQRQRIRKGICEEICLLEDSLPIVTDDANKHRALLLLLENRFKAASPTQPYMWNSYAKEMLIKQFESLCTDAIQAFKNDSIILSIRSPAYVFGDTHGSYKDLDYFGRELDIIMSEKKFVFLGDFVDRGPNSVEVVVKLFLWKILFPQRMFLTRGNHEFRSTNGKDHGELPFKRNCIVFADGNEQLGNKLYETINQVFEWLPLVAIIDEKVFCTHGGIPRTIEHMHSKEVIEKISNFPRPIATIDTLELLDLMWMDLAEKSRIDEEEALSAFFGVDVEEIKKQAQIISDAKEESSKQPDNKKTSTMFIPNPVRGPDMLACTDEALGKFFGETGYEMLIRGHQFPKSGYFVSASGTTIIAFSSSGYVGNNNRASVVQIEGGIVKILLGPSPPPKHETESKKGWLWDRR